MKLKHLAAAAVLATGAAGSWAVGGPLDLSTGSTGFATTPTAGAFTDLWTFTLTAPGIISGSITSILNGAQDVDFTSIQITGVGPAISFSQLLADPVETWGLVGTTVAAGSYTLRIAGTNSAAIGSYAGNLAVSPVPEAETYAMLLAGLLAVGMKIRPRRG